MSELPWHLQAAIPWEQRRELGAIRAFARTVWSVSFTPQYFCEAIIEGPSENDARRFSQIAIALIALPTIAVVLVWALFSPSQPLTNDDMPPARWLTWWMAACPTLLLICLFGVARDFLSPGTMTPERRSRAIALSYYAIAPFVWWTIVPVLFLVILFATKLNQGVGFVGAILLAVLWFGETVFWFRKVIALGKRMVPLTESTYSDFVLKLAAAWLLTHVFVLMLLPVCGFYIALMLRSVY